MKIRAFFLVTLASCMPLLASAQPSVLWQNPGCAYPATVAIGELDSSPGLEIAGGLAGGGILCLKASGETAWSCPTPGLYPTGIKIADVDADGINEVVYVARETTNATIGCVSAPGVLEWSVAGIQVIPSCPAVVNIDADPDLEILTFSNDGILRVHDGHGNLEHSFRVDPYEGDWQGAAPVAGDLDGDGQIEVVLFTWASTGDDESIVCVDPTTGVTEWTAVLGVGNVDVFITPSLYDLEGDGVTEVLANYHWRGPYSLRRTRRVCIEVGGDIRWATELSGFYYTTNPGAVGDIDGDGVAEFVCPNSEGIYTVDGSGAEGWDLVQDGSYSSPALVDLGADGSVETLIDNYATLLCLDSTGSLVWSFPTGQNTAFDPLVADLDRDGTAEVVLVTNTGGLYCIATHQPLGGDAWPTYHGDNANTGSAHRHPADVADVAAARRAPVRVTSATGSLPLRFEVASKMDAGSYSIVDPQGREIWNSVLRTDGPTTWSGRGFSGDRVSPGVYFLRAHGADGGGTARVIVLE